jgi:PAS domain S-box-containing protein
MTQLLPIGVKSGRVRLDGPRVAELEARLREAEETIEAIRNGDVDAVVVDGPAGHQVYTLENADRPYRVLIEQMQEGAVTMSNDGTVLYCNQRFATIVGTRRESIIGGLVSRYFSDDEHEVFQRLLSRRSDDGAAGEFTLRASGDVRVPVNISLIELKADGGMSRVVCGVITDLTHNRRRGKLAARARRCRYGKLGP